MLFHSLMLVCRWIYPLSELLGRWGSCALWAMEFLCSREIPALMSGASLAGTCQLNHGLCWSVFLRYCSDTQVFGNRDVKLGQCLAKLIESSLKHCMAG